jgi:hypothetical protein
MIRCTSGIDPSNISVSGMRGRFVLACVSTTCSSQSVLADQSAATVSEEGKPGKPEGLAWTDESLFSIWYSRCRRT